MKLVSWNVIIYYQNLASSSLKRLYFVKLLKEKEANNSSPQHTEQIFIIFIHTLVLLKKMTSQQTNASINRKKNQKPNHGVFCCFCLNLLWRAVQADEVLLHLIVFTKTSIIFYYYIIQDQVPKFPWKLKLFITYSYVFK